MSELGNANIDELTSRLSAVAAACLISKVYTTSDAFFANAPSQYQPYYFQVVRKCQQFYDGFVPSLHNGPDGIFSTRSAAALCSGFSNKVIGGKIGFRKGAGSGDSETVSWLSHRWAPQNDFTTFCRQSVEYAYAFGTTLIKLNRDASGNYWPSCSRLDDFVFSCGGKDDLRETKSLVKAYSSTASKGDSKGLSYFMIERRFFQGSLGYESWIKDGVRYLFPNDERIPCVEYQVVLVDPAQGTQTHNLQTATPQAWDDLPDDVKDSIKKDYGMFKVGEPARLPFANGCLGAWLLKSKGYDGSAPNMPFGQSVLRDIFTELAELDIIASFQMRDIHNGTGTVFTPKQYDMSDLAPAVAVDQAGNQITVRVGDLSAPYAQRPSNFQTLPGDPDTMKPFCNQFALRPDDWTKLCDHAMRMIATKLNTSPKVISASLAPAMTEKSATEVDSDDDATTDWTELQRSILSEPFNRMIECLLSVMGRVGNAEIRFGNIGLRSKSKALDHIIPELEHHLITRADSIRELNPELDEEQVKQKIAECESEEANDRLSQPVLPDLNGNYR